MKPFDLLLVYLTYTNGASGKTRPVLMIQEKDGYYLVYKITSQFFQKSEIIQKKYYPIRFWKEAGLDKPSWIDTGTIAAVRCTEVQQIVVGHLSTYDIKGLAKFLQQIDS